MAPNFGQRLVAGALMIYLLAMALFASASLVASFDSRPTTQGNRPYAAAQSGTLAGSQGDAPIGGANLTLSAEHPLS